MYALVIFFSKPHLYLTDHYRSRRLSLDKLLIELPKPDIEARERHVFIRIFK